MSVAGPQLLDPHFPRERARGHKAAAELLKAVSHWLDNDGDQIWELQPGVQQRLVPKGPGHEADRQDFIRLKSALVVAMEAIERQLSPPAKMAGIHRRQTALIARLHRAYLLAAKEADPGMKRLPSIDREGEAVRFIHGALDLLGERPVPDKSAIAMTLRRHCWPVEL
ncbi:hypothetical protein [Sabulicella glaciei]|uniref:Uncharacterized protein n=1 Tax=Sabulicella glaciei TaxID=2984948 RepID=A0ABT3NWQ6_9PROT|nr:hypothetical protein [Roseococcus sp. MDT2-1-1]MCW8086606.1 hypothetical protein [Roseococcus sp. MDT2-1-1]